MGIYFELDGTGYYLSVKDNLVDTLSNIDDCYYDDELERFVFTPKHPKDVKVLTDTYVPIHVERALQMKKERAINKEMEKLNEEMTHRQQEILEKHK
jgi:hypothetical protein